MKYILYIAKDVRVQVQILEKRTRTNAHVRVRMQLNFGIFAHVRAMCVRPKVEMCECACVRPKKSSQLTVCQIDILVHKPGFNPGIVCINARTFQKSQTFGLGQTFWAEIF